MKKRSQSEHLLINAIEYPGTRQLCCECGSPTLRCEEDSIYFIDKGPLCDRCLDEYEVAYKASTGFDYNS